MNPILILLTILTGSFFSSPACPPNAIVSEQLTSGSGYFTEIPVTYVRDKILIQVEIGGKARTFLLDTGAPFMVDEALAREMGYREVGSKGLKDASGNRTRVQKVKVPELFLGSTRFSNLPALVYDFRSSLLGCFQIDGIIGSNILKKSVLQFDLAEGVIRLTNKSDKLDVAGSDAISIRLKPKQFNPMVPVRINGEILIWSLLDTGSDDFYSISKEHLAAIQKKGQLTEPALSRTEGSASLGLMGGNESAFEILVGLESLAFQDQPITGQVAIESNHDNDSRIGMRLLERGVLTLDYRKKRIWFKPYPDHEDYRYIQFGLGFVPEGDSWVIREVWSGSDAEREGLVRGDTLLEYGDLTFSGMSVCDVMFQLPAERDKSSIRIKVRHVDGRGDRTYFLRQVTFFGD